MPAETGFGGYSDHWDLVGSGIGQSDNLVVVESSRVPVAQSRANAEDENGDIAASAFFGNSEGSLSEISTTYALKGGTLDLSTVFFLGEKTAGKIAGDFEASTDNGAWPQITLSGMEGVEPICTVAGKEKFYDLPAVTLAGCKRAQEMGFTADEGRLTSASISASIDIADQADGLGQPVAHGVSGGEGEVSAEFVRIDAEPPAWSVTGGWLTETQTPGVDQGQSSWHTASGTAAFTVERATT